MTEAAAAKQRHPNLKVHARQPAQVVPRPAAQVGARPSAALSAGSPPGKSGLVGGASATATNVARRLTTILTLQARALADTRFEASATAIASELCAMLQCERVSIGLYARGHSRVHAVSNTGDLRRERNVLRLIAAAMDEAIDQHATIVYPLPSGASPSIVLAHAQLSAAGSGVAVCSVPIANGKRILGVFLLERRRGFDHEAVRLAADAATFVGPVIELKCRVDAPIGGRIVEALKRRGKRLIGVEPSLASLVALALVGILGIVAAWPTTYRVVSPARVEGSIQRAVVAPVEGFLREVHGRPGLSVAADQVLATLEDRDLHLEREKLLAESNQVERQYREALAKDDASPIVVARAKLEHLASQLELVERQLGRTVLRAPFDGIIISGDLSQLIGSPVKRGQELMTIAPANSFRIVVEVDEQDIEGIRPGQTGRVMFAATAGYTSALRVTRVAPSATAREGRNFFEVESHPDQNDARAREALRPGLQGIAKIDLDERRMLQVWSQRASNWLRRTLWRLSG